jgi:ubiquinone/menaquinone biosynthesis C-methylase UbiE
MAKEGEIGILRKQGERAIRFGLSKPWATPDCPSYLIRVGALLSLLPPPPARLLDLGCGMGWTSVFFAKRGYDVVGVDISPDKIDYANVRKTKEECETLEFQVSDYESLTYEDEFDCAVFFDSLHHAMDEELALRMAHRALKVGGVCVTAEPGDGHSQQVVSLEAVAQYNVTEKDMPPRLVRKLGQKVGFRDAKVYPQPYRWWLNSNREPSRIMPGLVSKWSWAYNLRTLYRMWRQLAGLDREGVVVLTK